MRGRAVSACRAGLTPIRAGPGRGRQAAPARRPVAEWRFARPAPHNRPAYAGPDRPWGIGGGAGRGRAPGAARPCPWAGAGCRGRPGSRGRGLRVTQGRAAGRQRWRQEPADGGRRAASVFGGAGTAAGPPAPSARGNRRADARGGGAGGATRGRGRRSESEAAIMAAKGPGQGAPPVGPAVRR